jgi:DNA-binding PadR family transcriptional regulator
MRGHLNMIVLEIVKEKPRHGYDVIKAIEEKFHGFYSPSAGSVYPILQELEDQGFVASSRESGKKVYAITKEGENELKKNEDKFSDMREHLRVRFGGMERLSGKGTNDEPEQNRRTNQQVRDYNCSEQILSRAR